MGIFVNYPSNVFAGIKDTPQTIVSADTHVLWITSILVCNRGAAPIRFNLQKVRIQALALENPCYGTTTANLNAIYNNGISGVGATLTNNGPLAIFGIDGVVPPLNSRILIKNQSATFQNGIYTLSTVGNGAIPWILTRSTDFNIVSKIQNGDLVSVQNGVVNSNTKWIQTSTITAIGVSPITFTSSLPTIIFHINELEIKPYKTIDVIDITGELNLEYSITPFVSDSLVCFSNGYTQEFDCDVSYAQLNELPMG